MRTKIFLLIFGFSFFLNSCNYRTKSNVRFEKNTGIKFPDSVKVIQDRFEDADPDYALYYEFITNEEDCLKILQSLETSREWKKTQDSLTFSKTVNGIIYSIQILVDKKTIIYIEELI